MGSSLDYLLVQKIYNVKLEVVLICIIIKLYEHFLSGVYVKLQVTQKNLKLHMTNILIAILLCILVGLSNQSSNTWARLLPGNKPER